jgi:hypothetical protein
MFTDEFGYEPTEMNYYKITKGGKQVFSVRQEAFDKLYKVKNGEIFSLLTEAKDGTETIKLLNEYITILAHLENAGIVIYNTAQYV